MTDEILSLMNKSNQIMAMNSTKYKMLSRHKNEMQANKRNKVNEKCIEIEKLQNIDIASIYKKTK